MIDVGAERALRSGKSLLPRRRPENRPGRFERGDAVIVKSEMGRELARGLVAHNSDEAKLLAGNAHRRYRSHSRLSWRR